jgi:hypothetical protein
MRFIWKQVPLPAALALEEILWSWDGTPYMVGQQQKKIGVDCVRFVCGVVDELRARQTPIQTLPNDGATHNRNGAVSVMHALLNLFQPCSAVEDETVEPGDVMVWAPRNGGPGHATIAGCRSQELWEAGSVAVHRTSPTALERSGMTFVRTFRPADKADWGV